MGPVGGGRFREPSESLKEIVDAARSTPEVALRFVLSNPHVTAAISGMGTREMVDENCTTAARAEALSEGERIQIEGALDRLKELANLYCTGCNYCMPCPSGVNIPANFLAMNMARVYGLEEQARTQYQRMAGKASYCIACGECEPACPQDIPIREQLREVAARFDPGYGTMMLDLVPVRRDASVIRARALFHNVSDQSGRARVEFRSSGVTIEPAVIETTIDEPFHASSMVVRFEGVDRPSGVVNVETSVEDAAGKRDEAFAIVFGTCSHAEPTDALGDSADPSRLLGFDRDEQVHLRDNTNEKLPEVGARTACTAEAFVFRARIGPEEFAGVADGVLPRVDVMLDLRNRKRFHAPGFQEGMCWIRLFPAAAGDAERLRVVRGKLNAEDLEVETGEEAGDIALSVPWASLGASAPSEGDAFGFDWIYERTDSSEHRRLRLVWSGNRMVHRDGRLGALFRG
jgi:ferredoxin